MGQKNSCAAATSKQVSPHGVLVVYITGQTDEFPAAVKAKVVLRDLSDSHFVCRWKDVQLHLHAVNPLKPEEDLRMGEIYLVLPMSVLHSDVSPRALMALANKLLTSAKKAASKPRSKKRRAEDANLGIRSSSCRMHDRLVGSSENPELQMAYKEHLNLLEKTRSWKPRLYTIQEISLVR